MRKLRHAEVNTYVRHCVNCSKTSPVYNYPAAVNCKNGHGPLPLPAPMPLQRPFAAIPIKSWSLGASLVAQCLRIRLPMQGTQVRALVWEDPTCRRAPKPVCHNY